MLTPRASFWTAAAVAALALWASGAPSIVYPVYAADWGLTPTVITVIFALYPVSLVAVLVLLGGISDYIGRRAAMLAGLAVLFVGIALFALAPSVGWLFAGRIMQGIGVGLAMSPASAAMVEFVPSGGSARATSINTAATAIGLAAATIVGGALMEYAPWPRHLSFVVLAALTVVVFAAVWAMPRHTRAEATGAWRPGPIGIPSGLGRVVTVSAFAISAAFGMGAIMLSLGSQIAKDLIGTDDALVSGVSIAAFAIVVVAVAVVARKMEPRSSIVTGGFVAAAGMGMLVTSGISASLPLFLASSVVAGIGYGFLFLGGLGVLNRHAPAHHRAQSLSVVYLIAYLAQGLIAVAVGVSATAFGLGRALDFWAPAVAALCLTAAAIALLGATERGLRGDIAPAR